MKSLRILSLVALFAFSAHAAAGKTEPRYKGKPLAYWVERLQTGATDTEQQQAALAVAAFGANADSAVPKLLELLDDRSPEYRQLIAEVLCEIAVDAKSVVPAMIKLLKEDRARDPKLVIEVLGTVGPKAKEAVPYLKDALKRDDAKIRLAAAGALWWVAKNPDGVPALVEVVKGEKSGCDENTFLRAVDLLGEIGPGAKSALPCAACQQIVVWRMVRARRRCHQKNRGSQGQQGECGTSEPARVSSIIPKSREPFAQPLRPISVHSKREEP